MMLLAQLGAHIQQKMIMANQVEDLWHDLPVGGLDLPA
jgi:hypothetical protein